MDADERWFPGRLLELDATECWERVRSRETGREAYLDGLGRLTPDAATGRRLLEA